MPRYKKTQCTDEMRNRHLVNLKPIRREFCLKRRYDIPTIDTFEEQEAILRELRRATRDVLMLRLAKVRVETTNTPTFNNRLGSYKDLERIFK